MVLRYSFNSHGAAPSGIAKKNELRLSWPVSTLAASAIRLHIARSWPKWKRQIFNVLTAVQNFFKSEEESLGGTVKRLFARIAQSICRRALAKTRSNTLLFRRLGPILDPMGFALTPPGLAWRGAQKD